MRINEVILKELDGLNIGRALAQAFGAKLDPKNPTITKKNLEYIRDYVPQEAAKSFIDDMSSRGILLTNGTINRRSSDGKRYSAAELADIARAVQAELIEWAKKVFYAPRFDTKDNRDKMFAAIDASPPLREISSEGILNWFTNVNAVYYRLADQVSRATAGPMDEIIDALAKSINALSRTSGGSGVSVEINSYLTALIQNPAYARAPFLQTIKTEPWYRTWELAVTSGPDASNWDGYNEVYQKIIQNIYSLVMSKKLTIEHLESLLGKI